MVFMRKGITRISLSISTYNSKLSINLSVPAESCARDSGIILILAQHCMEFLNFYQYCIEKTDVLGMCFFYCKYNGRSWWIRQLNNSRDNWLRFFLQQIRQNRSQILIHDQIIKALIQQEITALCLLDLSAAFENTSLVCRLYFGFSFKGTVLSWL